MSRHKKIVITGASGFLGSHLTERLKNDKRYGVYALSSRPDDLEGRIGGENVEYLHKDVIASEQAQEILKDAVIVNCAYPRNSTGMAIADGLKYIQGVFEAAMKNKAAAIINISSQSVYSQQRTEAATEETPLCLESQYAVGKYAVELMLESICNGSSTAYTSLRTASLIGPGFDQRIVNRFVKQALETGKLTVKRNQQRFAFFDVEDAVSGIMSMLRTDEQRWKPVYNLGKEGSYSLIEIAETIAEVVKNQFGVQIELNISNGDEINNSELICSRFAKDFGFESRMTLVQSVITICQNEVFA